MKEKARGPFLSGVSVTRLRLGFILLGGVLLSGLLSLAWAVEMRLAETRHERQEMVALRVFDELEREVTTFLEGEGARPHYERLEDTNPSAWTPFVVGYFKESKEGDTEVVAAPGIDDEPKRRIAWALSQFQLALNEERQLTNEENVGGVGRLLMPTPSAGPARTSDIMAKRGAKALAPEMHEKDEVFGSELGVVEQEEAEERAAPRRASARAKSKPHAVAAPQSQEATGSEIIQSLNRAPTRRKSLRSSPKKKANPRNKDQFLDYKANF